MALSSVMTRIRLPLSPPIVRVAIRYFCQHEEAHKSVSIEVDALDDFTSQLIQKKTDKWEMRKLRAQKLVDDNVCNHKGCNTEVIDIKEIGDNHLNTLFQTAIDYQNDSELVKLMNQCIEYKKCPSLSILLHVLSIYSRKGDKDTVVKIKGLCENTDPKILQDYSNFDHFFAEAVWVKGNIVDSLKIFEIVYKENAILRRRIRIMLKHLIAHMVTNRSEAALINIIKFSESLVNNFQDYYPLICTWEACFLSEWFTDQCIAFDLLEKYNNLAKLIVHRIPYVVTVSLRSYRTDVVYRLLEVLLKYQMKPQYSRVLISLFEHQCK